MKKQYTIGQVAKYLNISVEAIRFYEKKGVIPQFIRGENNYRLIDHKHLLFLKGVIQLKQAGFSLQEIKKIQSDNFSFKPEKQYQVLSDGIENIQEQINILEQTKEKLKHDITELKYFYSLVAKDCFTKRINNEIEIVDLNNLTIEHLLAERDLFFTLQGKTVTSSLYLLKAFLYKTDSDIENVIEHMMQCAQKKRYTCTGTILLSIKAAPSYYTGDVLAAIIYIGLEENDEYKAGI